MRRPSRSVEALLARPDVDVVVIATPHSTHLDLALATAAAGKHLYLEKPMALDTAECDRIIEACRAAGVALTVAKQTRHGDPEMLAKQLIDDGAIGDIRYIRPMSPTIGAGLAPGSHWSSDPKEGKASSTGAAIAATRSAGSRAARRSACRRR